MPTCPHLFPSLDHPSGYYCRLSCGGNCHNSFSRWELPDNNVIARVSGDEQPRTAPSCSPREQGQLSHAIEGGGCGAFQDFPLGNVSDSLKRRGSSSVIDGTETHYFPLGNVSDSLKSRCIDDADPGEEDDQLYEMFCRSGQFWHEAGPYTSKGRTYYRYRWGHGHAIDGVRHIPGGSMLRGLVRERAAIVERAVYVDFRPHAEILALIDGWRVSRPKIRL